MKEQAVIQRLLRKKFADLQSANPRYSLRSFSRKVGLNPGALSGILNGKRNASSKLVQRIAERLLLDPQERSELFSHFKLLRYEASDGENENGNQFRVLSAAQFR